MDVLLSFEQQFTEDDAMVVGDFDRHNDCIVVFRAWSYSKIDYEDDRNLEYGDDCDLDYECLDRWGDRL
jgi:hypothetical protein